MEKGENTRRSPPTCPCCWEGVYLLELNILFIFLFSKLNITLSSSISMKGVGTKKYLVKLAFYVKGKICEWTVVTHAYTFICVWLHSRQKHFVFRN